MIQLTRQLWPIDLGQSIDRECWCKREMMGLVSEGMDGRGLPLWVSQGGPGRRGMDQQPVGGGRDAAEERQEKRCR